MTFRTSGHKINHMTKHTKGRLAKISRAKSRNEKHQPQSSAEPPDNMQSFQLNHGTMELHTLEFRPLVLPQQYQTKPQGEAIQGIPTINLSQYFPLNIGQAFTIDNDLVSYSSAAPFDNNSLPSLVICEDCKSTFENQQSFDDHILGCRNTAILN